MATDQRSTVVGVFQERASAERAVDELRRVGFDSENIGFALHDGDTPQIVTDAGEDSKTGEGAVTGMVTGGLLGGLTAAAVSLFIPGIGPVLGGGIIATTLGGAAAGAAVGGLLGALVGLGVPEEEARYYQGEFESGRTIVTVTAGPRTIEAADILSRAGGYDMQTTALESPRAHAFAAHPTSAAIQETATTRGADAPATGLSRPSSTEALPAGAAAVSTAPGPPGESRTTSTAANTGPETEEMPVGKWPVRADDPHAGKYVEGEEHVSTSDALSSGPHVPGQAPSPRPGEAQTTGGVQGISTPPPKANHGTTSGGGRTAETNTGPYMDRSEDLERVGATTGMAPGAGAGSWSEASSRYRRRWQARQGATGGRWEDVEPGYHYGHEMASDPRHQGREWSEVEAGLGAEYPTWAQRQGYRATEGGWSRVKDHARESWEGVRERGSR